MNPLSPDELSDLRDEYLEKPLDNCRGDYPCQSETCRRCLGETKARANQRRLACAEEAMPELSS